VAMITYNHARYIAEAIQGVVRQEADFPFELVIGEDCSTDGTREIVFDYQRRYPQTIRVVTSAHNVGVHANAVRAYDACRGKYVAFCDGDDYWQNPHKLQLQVDFLETHAGYSLVHTDADWLVDATGEITPCWHKTHRHAIVQGDVYEHLLVDNHIMTCTVCVRKKDLDRCMNDPAALRGEDRIVGDYPRWLLLSMASQIGYLDVSTATRRVLIRSASKSPDSARNFAFFLEMYGVREHFIRLRPPSPRIQAQIQRNYHQGRLKHGYLLQDSRIAGDSYRYLADAGLLSVTSRLHLLGSKGRAHHAVARTLLALKDMVRQGWPAVIGGTRRRRTAG